MKKILHRIWGIIPYFNIFNVIETIGKAIFKARRKYRGIMNTELDLLHLIQFLINCALLYIIVGVLMYHHRLIKEYMVDRLKIEMPPVIETIFPKPKKKMIRKRMR